MVESWRELVAAEFVECERIGADEDARPTTFREFLTGYRYSNADLERDELVPGGDEVAVWAGAA